MASNQYNIAELLAKYARRETLSEEEMSVLESWRQRSAENASMFDQFADEQWVAKQLAQRKNVPRAGTKWADIAKRLAETDDPSAMTVREIGWYKRRRLRRRRNNIRLMVTTALVLICAGGGWWFFFQRPSVKGDLLSPTAATPDVTKVPVPADDAVLLIASDGSLVNINSLPVRAIVAQTDRGILYKRAADYLAFVPLAGEHLMGAQETTTVAAPSPGKKNLVWQGLLIGRKGTPYHLRLPDGSTVWLAGGSRFRYPLTGRGMNATCSLEGKGWFSVAKDPSRPFVISLPNDRMVRVTGTEFNVEAYHERPEAKVALFTGALQLLQHGSEVAQLKPAQEAVMRSGRPDVRPMKDSTAVKGWLSRSLFFHFDKTECTDALAAVAAWYGCTVSNPQGLRGMPITGDLWRNDDPSPDRVLWVIEQIESGYIHLKRIGNVIEVSTGP
ncbi:FecR family protein [Puia dinghuensis]|uniref:FecR protein domain-containing protein n=1 Tax=Puia dinghuensis TaxID=1792502 RepID=A0A8J2UIV6_9BACT|nr:FecR family protein [Puia dinghuensis]GGB23645.1 hypothetical protein GCM10011511_54380 [Puia dinghuensis]